MVRIHDLPDNRGGIYRHGMEEVHQHSTLTNDRCSAVKIKPVHMLKKTICIQVQISSMFKHAVPLQTLRDWVGKKTVATEVQPRRLSQGNEAQHECHVFLHPVPPSLRRVSVFLLWLFPILLIFLSWARVEQPSSEAESPPEWAQHLLLYVELMKSVFLVFFFLCGFFHGLFSKHINKISLLSAFLLSVSEHQPCTSTHCLIEAVQQHSKAVEEGVQQVYTWFDSSDLVSFKKEAILFIIGLHYIYKKM